MKIRKKVASRAMRNIRLRSFASGQRGKEGEWERGRKGKKERRNGREGGRERERERE